MPGTKGDSIGRIAEQANELRREHIGGNADQLRKDHGAGNAEGHTFVDTVEFPGPQILADEGAQRHGKAGDGQKGKALNLGVGSAACHGGFSKAVDIGLNHHIGNGNHGILHAGGQAKLHNPLQTGQMEADLPPTHPVGFPHTHQMHTAQQCTDTLRNGGGHGGGTDPQTEHGNEQQIQHHIDAGGEDQIVQRVLAVAYGVEDAYENIVHHREDRTAEIVAEIADGLGQHLLRCSHPPQNRGGEDDTRNRQQNARRQAEGNIGMDGFAHIFLIPCAKIPGDDGAGPHGHTVEKANHHKNQAA